MTPMITPFTILLVSDWYSIILFLRFRLIDTMESNLPIQTKIRSTCIDSEIFRHEAYCQSGQCLLHDREQTQLLVGLLLVFTPFYQCS